MKPSDIYHVLNTIMSALLVIIALNESNGLLFALIFGGAVVTTVGSLYLLFNDSGNEIYITPIKLRIQAVGVLLLACGVGLTFL